MRFVRSSRRPSAPGAVALLLGGGAVLAGLLPGASSASPGTSQIADRIAATVDEIAIPESELRKAMAVSALTPNPGETAGAFRTRVLDALIDQKLQYREALRFAPAAPEPSVVDASVARVRARLEREGRHPDAEFRAAGMTPEEVRAALERQIVVQNYLAERFRPIAVADEDRAHEEYDTRYVPEERSAGRAPEPYEKVAEEMRRRVQQRVFDEESARWLKEIRQKAAIAVYDPDRPMPAGGTPVPISSPKPLPTAKASQAPPSVIR